jgi:hypothetical protein
MRSATTQRTIGVRSHRPKLRLALAISALAFTVGVPPLQAQSSDSLFGRWVGTHGGRPLFFDFYGDSMLVVNDRYPLSFTYTRDSLRAYGDTSLAVQYFFSLGRMMIRNADGTWVTMSPQDLLARPMHGTWYSDLGDGRRMIIYVQRGGPARWRMVPGGSWTVGEWERQARSLTFTWEPDSIVWQGYYDAPRALILEEDASPSGLSIFRRIIR